MAPFIGGSDELFALDVRGELDKLLAQPACHLRRCGQQPAREPRRLMNTKGESVGLSHLERHYYRHKRRNSHRRGKSLLPTVRVDLSLLEMSPHTSVCPIKGAARFFHVRAGDALNVNAAWTYPAPTPDAEGIRDYIAFWKGVDVA
jgi:hypothetical protein